MNALAFEPVTYGPLEAAFDVTAMGAVQHGNGVNFGFGAFDHPGDAKRTVVFASLEPRLALTWAFDRSTVYGVGSVVAAGTYFDGEIGGQFGRSGDETFDNDEAHLGWRNGLFDISLGAQEFIVGDGLLIGDGNFDTGADDGQYWLLPFTAWRNSVVAKLTHAHLRGQLFWLRSDRDFGDSYVAGVNLESEFGVEYGTLGFMYLDVLQGNQFNYDGIEVWNVRGAEIRHPLIPNLTLFGEYVAQRGRDDDGTGADNEADGWYIEARYAFPKLPWSPAVHYRYLHLSGDELDTPENEEFRGLFFTTGTRGWDTWYQGEIASQYHLFNQNQVTQMVKATVSPAPRWTVSLYYYSFDLEEPQFLGTPVSSTDWADEYNLMFEYALGERLYVFAALAWSPPGNAVKQLFGDDDFTVLETFFAYTF